MSAKQFFTVRLIFAGALVLFLYAVADHLQIPTQRGVSIETSGKKAAARAAGNPSDAPASQPAGSTPNVQAANQSSDSFLSQKEALRDMSAVTTSNHPWDKVAQEAAPMLVANSSAAASRPAQAASRQSDHPIRSLTDGAFSHAPDFEFEAGRLQASPESQSSRSNALGHAAGSISYNNPAPSNGGVNSGGTSSVVPGAGSDPAVDPPVADTPPRRASAFGGSAFSRLPGTRGGVGLDATGIINGDLIVDPVDNPGGPTTVGPTDILAVTGNITVGKSSTAVFTQNGGAFLAGSNPDSKLILGAQAGSSGTYNLDGGQLVTNSIGRGVGAGTFYFNGGTLQAGVSDNPATANPTTFLQGLSSAEVRDGGALIETNGHNVTIAQNLTHSSITGDNATDGGLSKSGAGALTLTGTNTYTGLTAVAGGTLSISRPGNLGPNGVNILGTSQFLATQTMVLRRNLILGDVSFDGPPLTTTATIAVATGKTLAIQSSFCTLGPNMTMVIGTAANAGTVTLSSTYGFATSGGTAALRVAAGTFRAGGDATLPFLTNYFPTTTVVAGATLDYDGSLGQGFSLYDAVLRGIQGGGTVLTGGTSTTNLSVGAGNFSGVIDGPGQITKTTTNTLTLSGANTYTGGTNVAAGTLLVNNTAGSGTGPGNVLVTVGGKLGGRGIISGDLTAGTIGSTSTAVVAPGSNGAGILTIRGAFNLQSTARLEIELGGLTAGTQYDGLNVGGALTLGGSLKVTFISGFTPSPGQTFYIIDNTGAATALSGAFLNAPIAAGRTGIYTDAAGNKYTVNYAAHDPADLDKLNNDVSLTLVPEPSAWTLLMIAASGVLVARIFRCRCSI